MSIYIQGGWMLFCIAFGVFLLLSFIMGLQSRKFYTLDVVVRKFGIMDLEFPASPLEVVNLIKGIYALPPEQSKKTLRALRSQLYLDFLFMPVAYGAIFLACMKVSLVMSSGFGQTLFAVLAWLQLLPWACDIIENVYLLQKLKPDVTASSRSVHKAYEGLEVIKWGISLTGAICAISAMLYFWLTGNYSSGSLTYLLILVAELIVFFIAGKIAFKKIEQEEEEHTG